MCHTNFSGNATKKLLKGAQLSFRTIKGAVRMLKPVFDATQALTMSDTATTGHLRFNGGGNAQLALPASSASSVGAPLEVQGSTTLALASNGALTVGSLEVARPLCDKGRRARGPVQSSRRALRRPRW